MASRLRVSVFALLFLLLIPGRLAKMLEDALKCCTYVAGAVDAGF